MHLGPVAPQNGCWMHPIGTWNCNKRLRALCIEPVCLYVCLPPSHGGAVSDLNMIWGLMAYIMEIYPQKIKATKVIVPPSFLSSISTHLLFGWRCFNSSTSFFLRFPACTCTTVCWCWRTPSTVNWRTENGTAWPAWTAWGNQPSHGTEAGPCWTPSRRSEDNSTSFTKLK